MTNFNQIVPVDYVDDYDNKYTNNLYAGRDGESNWIAGYTSIQFLENNFGQYSTAQEMIDSTIDEGLKLYFQRLKDQGKLN